MGEEDGEIGGGGRVLRSAPWRAAARWGRFLGERGAGGGWGRWMDAREIQNPYIKTQPGQRRA